MDKKRQTVDPFYLSDSRGCTISAERLSLPAALRPACQCGEQVHNQPNTKYAPSTAVWRAGVTMINFKRQGQFLFNEKLFNYKNDSLISTLHQ